jgi:hypothetical protein
MNDDYLVGYSVNILDRAIRIYSNVGTVKEVLCDTKEEFLSVVEFIDKTLTKEDWNEH